MARTKASRGAFPFTLRSGNSPVKFGNVAGILSGQQTNMITNMKAMMDAKKAAGDDFDAKAWAKENLEGGMMGTLKNQGEGGGNFGSNIRGAMGGAKLAAMHDKLHGKDGGGIEGPNLQPGIMSKKYKYTKK